MDDTPDMMTDLHVCARQWFTVKTINGVIPEQVVGGELDGLNYYPITLGDGDDTVYWLTEVGLFTPPSCLRP